MCCRIYIVDDACPEESGDFVLAHCTDTRVVVIRNPVNQGVGGAVVAGYLAAIRDGMDIAVKIDGDGQMDPALLPLFIKPILSGQADYCKGNRFFNLEKLATMPKIRLIGNSVLSLLSKLSTGYWDLFDPTNGYTAIQLDVAKQMPLHKLSQRYFFETDMLFRLNTLRARVLDIPMEARYGDERSGLRVRYVIGEFFWKNLVNTGKRIFYNYYLRDMSLASLELPIGAGLMLFGTVFGAFSWAASSHSGIAASTGTVMLSALPLLMGLQFLLAFVAHDIAGVPRAAIHPRLRHDQPAGSETPGR